MGMDFKGRVAIVTGAGGGLGKQHALLLASRGAKVVVNDLGGDVHGVGGSASAAQKVVDEIRAAGGEAIANGASVTDFEAVQKMVQQAMDTWGRVDVLVNNAGILRDKSFAKMTLDDFKLVMDVHVMGAVHCTKAVWPIMQAQNYGRIVMTTSSSGLYGNFGQANYGAAKMAIIGFLQTLKLEGQKYNIFINALAPVAADAADSTPPVAPVADFSGTPRSGTMPLLVHFSDASSGAPTSWLWNFGDGTIAAFDLSTGRFRDYLRGTDGQPLAIDGLWGLAFGNGVSLGDTDSLYFTAGPNQEQDGIFGRLRFVPCKDARTWASTLPADTTAEQAWSACVRGDWLLWLVGSVLTNHRNVDAHRRLDEVERVLLVPTLQQANGRRHVPGLVDVDADLAVVEGILDAGGGLRAVRDGDHHRRLR